MLDTERHPLLTRMVPFVCIRLWPLLIGAWGTALLLTPRQSSAVFGSTNVWVVDTLAIVTMALSATAFVAAKDTKVRLAFFMVAGFTILGRLATFIDHDTILIGGWRSRLIGLASYALISAAHVVITSVAVMLMTGGHRVPR